MARITSDHSLWPLGIVMLEGRQSFEQHMQMVAIWDSWFSRGERFLTLRIHVDSDALEHAPGAAKATKKWIKDGAGEKMRKLVAAMAIVVPPSSFEATRHLSTEAVFGVPGGIFPGTDESLEWLRTANNISPETTIAARDIVETFCK